METWQDLDHQLFTSFLPLVDSPNGLPKLKVVESIVLEIMGGVGSTPPPPFVEGVGTKYLRTRRVKICYKSFTWKVNLTTIQAV